MTLVMPGWLRRNLTPARTSSAMSSQLTEASLFLNREFIPRTLKPRLGNSWVDTWLKKSPVRWIAKKAVCETGPLLGTQYKPCPPPENWENCFMTAV